MQIIVKLTTNCNLKCVYCSEGDKQSSILPKELLYKAIDDLPVLLNKYAEKDISLLWHGGEPLTVGKKYLAEAMEYAAEKLKDFNLKFLIQTNGTLIDDEWIALFKKFNVSVGVSLDGYKELHDSNRMTKDEEPTFDLIIENIKRLKEAGLNCGTLMVLNTAGKIDLDKLIDCIEKYNFQPKIHPVISCGRAADTDSIPVYANYIELMKKLYTRCMESDSDIIIEPLNELMDAILDLAPVRECSFNGSCGKDFLCLYTDGNVSFCGRADNTDTNYLYGNIADKSLTELFESANAQLIRNRQQYLQQHECCNCPYWQFCHGGCSFEAVVNTGKLNSKYSNCEMRKKLIDFLQTEGLDLLKKRLLKQKQRYRLLIKEQEKMLGSLYDAGK